MGATGTPVALFYLFCGGPRRIALPAFLPVQSDRDARRSGAVMPYQVDGVVHRGPGGDHIINNQHPALQGCAGNHPAFAMVFFLLAVETVGHGTPRFTRAGNGKRRYQWDALVRRAEQHVELQAGVFDGLHIERAQLRYAGAVVKQPAVKEIRTAATGLERELAELQHLVANGEINKCGLMVFHGWSEYSLLQIQSPAFCPDVILAPSATSASAMKIITLNANGIRAASRKGFIEWMLAQDAEVVCLQEIKAQTDQLVAEILKPEGYFGYFNSAEKKGYSGVALYSRQEPERVSDTLGWDYADREGRYLQADYPGLSVISIYLPSGTSGDERQAVKYDFMERFERVLKNILQQKNEFIICGDWNIAHKQVDLKNWRSNRKNSGFLPEERVWLDKVFGELGLVDAFRVVNQEEEQYTWWSNRGQSWAKNVGWRIDYQVVTPGLAQRIKSVSIYKEQRFSDHAPLIIEYDM